MRYLPITLLAPLALATLPPGPGSAGATPGTTERVSVSSAGLQGNCSSFAPAISADGRYVAFASCSQNLVPGDFNLRADIFVHDRQTGATTRVSVSSAGVEGNGESLYPALSADGRFVAFETDASNLVLGDTNNTQDIFVHDRDADEDGIFDEPGAVTTNRVSVSSAGGEANHFSNRATISGDGRFVAFYTWASNLVPGDTNNFCDIDGDGSFNENCADVFVHDRETGITARASLSSTGGEANNSNSEPAISADGRHVVFHSLASNLVPDDTNGTFDIFVRDRDTDQDSIFDEPDGVATSRVSVSGAGGQGNEASFYPAISADGRYVKFTSWASDLVLGDTNTYPDIFIHDRETGATTRIDVGEPNLHGRAISADGRHVAFASVANDLVPRDTNGSFDVFLHDRDADGDAVFDEPGDVTTTRVSVSSGGRQGNDDSRLPAISADGRYVAFNSWASNLVPGDTYEQDDVFVHDRLGTFVLCGQRIATIVGTGGNDVLVGTAGPDVIHGLGGQDSIDGRGGDDLICGGDGNDTLVGGEGNDRLLGQGGDDLMDGGSGIDLCRGGPPVAGDSAVNCELISGVP